MLRGVTRYILAEGGVDIVTACEDGEIMAKELVAFIAKYAEQATRPFDETFLCG
jgi:hypothetical protein